MAGFLLPFWGGLALASSDFLPVVLEDMNRVYQPAAESMRLRLETRVIHDSVSVVASAHRDKDLLWIEIHGGLLRSPRLSEDGLRFVLCHELGHFFAGAPRKAHPFDSPEESAPDGLSFFSAEGQSDYYAASACFRRIVAGQDHGSFLGKAPVPPAVREKCERTWGRLSAESLVCQRTILAGLNMLLLVKDFPISVETPSEERVERTNAFFYPSRQCRLDTAVAGALCRSSLPLLFDFNDPMAVRCGNAEGLRPRCWFKPD
ncbi:MAG: hypothetical protein KF802_04245 [Bdellovibrionaceae bacterium]|nr:hypothetical protein [Pseudobdellovibrionaceae bacterium]